MCNFVAKLGTKNTIYMTWKYRIGILICVSYGTINKTV